MQKKLLPWISYLSKRLLYSCIALFLVATLTFFLIQNIPGDPFSQENAIPEEIMQSLKHYYGLDRPWYEQYARYLKGIVTFDLGPSFKYEARTVNDIIKDTFPVSLQLGLQALSFSFLMGVFLGSISAYFRRRPPDRMISLMIVLGVSVPSFILAVFFQYLFALKLQLFPVARWGSFSQTILPTLSLATLPTVFIAKMTRSSMSEVLQQDYILTAKIKGLSQLQIILRHVLRNSLLPIISYLGPLTASVVTGSFIIEKIFAIPGLGGWFVNSVINRDYTTIMGVTLFYSAILMFCVLIVDILYCLIDPRIKIEEADEY